MAPDLDEPPAPAIPADGGRLAARRQREAVQSAPGPSRRWGGLSGWYGTLIVFTAAVIGTVATVTVHRNPGHLLGAFIVAGTLVAALAVRSGAVYLLIPVPAPAYLAGAVVAGLLYEHYAGPSQSGLKISAAEWIAGGFVAMAAATAVAVVVTIIRWLMARRAVPGEPVPAPEPAAPPRPRSRAVSPSGPDSASWAKQPPRSGPPDGPEPPSWPWPEEPVARDRRPKQRDPAPPTDPFYRPRSSSRPEPPARPGPSSFGGPLGLADPVAPSGAPGGRPLIGGWRGPGRSAAGGGPLADHVDARADLVRGRLGQRRPAARPAEVIVDDPVRLTGPVVPGADQAVQLLAQRGQHLAADRRRGRSACRDT